MIEALSLLWWAPMLIVIVWGGLAVYAEYRDWKRRNSWYLPSDSAVYRPRAYRDQRQ